MAATYWSVQNYNNKKHVRNNKIEQNKFRRFFGSKKKPLFRQENENYVELTIWVFTPQHIFSTDVLTIFSWTLQNHKNLTRLIQRMTYYSQ